MPPSSSNHERSNRYKSNLDVGEGPGAGAGAGAGAEEEDDDSDSDFDGFDSDDDDDDDDNTDASYVETNVLLGYVEEGTGKEKGNKDGNGDVSSRDEVDEDGSVSFLGGWPIWLPSNNKNDDDITSSSANDPHTTPPSAHLVRCSACGSLMSLLLQLNANLPDRFPGHERRLYMFTCRRRACQRKKGCVGVVRGVRVDSEGSDSGEVKVKVRDGIDDGGENGTGTTNKERNISSTKQQRLGDAIFGVTPGSSSGSSMADSRNPFSLNPKGQSGMAGGENPFSTKAATLTLASTSASTSTSIPGSTSGILTTDTSKSSKHDSTNLPERFRSAVCIADDEDSNAGPTTHTSVIKDSNPSNTTTEANAAQSYPQPESNTNNTKPNEPWPPRSAFPAPYPKYILEADYETLDKTPDVPKKNLDISSEDAMQIDTNNITASANADANEKQIFESTLDKTFQRFADRLAQNPEQVLRYEFAGKPLLYSSGRDNDKNGHDAHDGGDGGDDDDVVRAFARGSAVATATQESKRTTKGSMNDGVGGTTNSIDSIISGTGTRTRTGTSGKAKSSPPACPNCNAPRVFEVQLTPHAIEVLEHGEAAETTGAGPGTGTGSGLDGMSWGTIIVAVCLADCRPADVKIGQVGYLKEWVGVQWEEELEEVKK